MVRVTNVQSIQNNCWFPLDQGLAEINNSTITFAGHKEEEFCSVNAICFGGSKIPKQMLNDQMMFHELSESW